MPRLAKCAFFVVCCLFIHAQPASADPFTFETLVSSGNIAGSPGATIGWGYTITNGSLTDWLVTTGLSADGFSNGIPNVLFDFPILAPGATVSVLYDALNGLGLYQLTWDPAAPGDFVNSGTFTVSAEWWDGDPFAGGNFVDVASDVSAPYSATVLSDTPTPLPVPSTLLLLATGLAVGWILRTDKLRLGVKRLK